MTRPLTRLLVANRGEIAVRIIRTARRMGIRCIAVFSDADAGSLHVDEADEAHRIGPAPASESYLSVPAILAATHASRADAVHPGYGFLSENADFAEACSAAGLLFVGPPAAAIRAMGSKSAAKALMQAAGVPVVPGFHGEDASAEELAAAASRIGYPVLLKPSAGGGGKGMRRVDRAEDLAAALAAARREAAHAFGDDAMLVERLLESPRHIEVQVFADTHGGTLHLFERDCSVQRRHQKVIEEAPAPGLSPADRAAMGQAAVTAARAVGYVGAGTVEFIVDGGGFYFMEMNTRLQVEHPVTEAITGLDLVEWQLRVARGESLPLQQAGIGIGGHAVEARLYAEDPARDFLPQTGLIRHLALPSGRPGVRVDTGVRSGDAVGIHYDPMIAKIIAHGADRAEALARLRAALDATEVVGLATNRDLLRAIAADPDFAVGGVDTGFIGRHRDRLLAAPAPAAEAVLALAALAFLSGDEPAPDPADPHSPWDMRTGWQPNLAANETICLAEGDILHRIGVRYEARGLSLELPSGPLAVSGSIAEDGTILADAGPVRLRGHAVRSGDRLALFVDGDQHEFALKDPRTDPQEAAGTAGTLVAPMTGTVIGVSAAVGDAVVKGSVLMVVEAMKMEHAIVAPRDGKVAALRYGLGDLVSEGAELLVLEAE